MTDKVGCNSQQNGFSGVKFRSFLSSDNSDRRVVLRFAKSITDLFATRAQTPGVLMQIIDVDQSPIIEADVDFL